MSQTLRRLSVNHVPAEDLTLWPLLTGVVKVQYANNRNLDFFVVNSAHSLTTSVEPFSGIQINLSNLRGIKIQPEKQTVILEAGALNHEVITALWNRGFVTSKISPRHLTSRVHSPLANGSLQPREHVAASAWPALPLAEATVYYKGFMG